MRLKRKHAIVGAVLVKIYMSEETGKVLGATGRAVKEGEAYRACSRAFGVCVTATVPFALSH